MARIVTHPRELPERKKPVPPGKPSVHESPYREPDGDPEEVDRFLAVLRDIKGLDRISDTPSR